MPNNKIIDLERLSRFKDKLDVVLETKANVDGNYPTMTVGSADNLTPYSETSGATDTTPFIFQTAGGNSDIGNKAYLRALRGNTIKWNQLANIDGTERTTTETGNLLTKYNYNHKYLFIFDAKGSSEFTCRFSTYIASSYINYCNITTSYQRFVFFVTAVSSGGVLNCQITSIPSGESVTYKNFQAFDLTELFGSGNEPTALSGFTRFYPLSYYSQNAGELLSSKVNGIKNVGYNAYDNANPNDYIKVIAGQTYTLEGSGTVALYDYDKNLLSDTFVSESALPNNCCFAKITGGNNTTCFHLTHDGSRTGYEPYKSETYQLPNVELRSNPATGTYDELKPDGTLVTRVGIRDYASGDSSDSTVTTDGTKTVYDLTTPTTEQTSNTYQEIMSIDDFGTQEFLYDEDIFPVPQGNEFFYPVDYKAFVDSLGGREDIKYDATQIVSKTQVPYSQWSGTQAEYEDITPDSNTLYFIEEE